MLSFLLIVLLYEMGIIENVTYIILVFLLLVNMFFKSVEDVEYDFSLSSVVIAIVTICLEIGIALLILNV